MLRMTPIRFDNQADCNTFQRLSPEGNCEILNGELSPVPAHGTKHQHVKSRLTAFLIQELENAGIGTVLGAPCNVMLSPWDVLQPDIIFIGRNRTGIIGERIILGSPDLVIEILSNDTLERNVTEKRRIYAESGVTEYWMVDPDSETVEIRTWSELGYISMGIIGKGPSPTSPLLPELNLDISYIFGHPGKLRPREKPGIQTDRII